MTDDGAGLDELARLSPRGNRRTPARRAAVERLRTLRRSSGTPPVGEERRRYRGIVAYDGTDYHGWQRQRELLTVQELLEAALDRATATVVTVHGSGRTDSGVHADGQSFAFDSETALPVEGILHRTRHLLPHDVRLVALERAADDFDPQRHAVGKHYRYTLLCSPRPSPAWERTCHRVEDELDLPAMQAAAAVLVGRHDFRSFRTDPGPARRDQDTVRTIHSLTVTPSAELLLVDVVGEGFLYMMVRNLVAALLAVGRGAWDDERVAQVLAARDRSLVPPPAPPQGLCLREVHYAR